MTAAEFWLEIYRELRRHIGDDRLPYPWRSRLRAIADRCYARATPLVPPDEDRS